MDSISYMMANHKYEVGDASVTSAVVLLQVIDDLLLSVIVEISVSLCFACCRQLVKDS